jgi:transposase
MRYELTDDEWAAIKPMLPNKPRGVPRVNDRRVLNGIFCNRNELICFSPYLYRARNLVERFFNKIKQCRRVATRYDKLAANYLAFIQLASRRLWLRANESTP